MLTSALPSPQGFHTCVDCPGSCVDPVVMVGGAGEKCAGRSVVVVVGGGGVVLGCWIEYAWQHGWVGRRKVHGMHVVYVYVCMEYT